MLLLRLEVALALTWLALTASLNDTIVARVGVAECNETRRPGKVNVGTRD
jgi:hypothetical protein